VNELKFFAAPHFTIVDPKNGAFVFDDKTVFPAGFIWDLA
jgi:hypothetical protein